MIYLGLAPESKRLTPAELRLLTEISQSPAFGQWSPAAGVGPWPARRGFLRLASSLPTEEAYEKS
jgi:hypothetical protein